MILGDTVEINEVDEDTKATEWVVMGLRLLAALGILYVLALAACVILALIHESALKGCMRKPHKPTKKEKQNGKRKLLIPSKEIQELMHPITQDDFESIVSRAIPPSPQPQPAEK